MRMTLEIAWRSSRLASTRPSGNPPADLGHLHPADRRVGAAGVAVGHEAVVHLDAAVGPGGDAARGAEVDVVGMRDDDQHALDVVVGEEGHGRDGNGAC
jgi:hypothetical protein